MPRLTALSAPPVPIRVGRRTIIPCVDAVGAALPARAVYPHLGHAELAELLDAFGDTYANPERTHLHMAAQGFAILGGGRTIVVGTCLGGPSRAGPSPARDSTPSGRPPWLLPASVPKPWTR